MEVLRKLNANTTIKVEGKTQVDVFRALGEAEEVFGQGQCGKCESTNVFFRARTAKDNNFYEMACRDCGAALAFGQHKQGETLFPKRKDADGNWLEHGGWKVWQRSEVGF